MSTLLGLAGVVFVIAGWNPNRVAPAVLCIASGMFLVGGLIGSGFLRLTGGDIGETIQGVARGFWGFILAVGLGLEIWAAAFGESAWLIASALSVGGAVVALTIWYVRALWR